MTTTKRVVIAAGGAAVTFALILLAIRIQFGNGLPSGLGLMPLYLLLPAEILGEVLGSRAVFLTVGFLEFFFVYMLGLRCWEWLQARKGAWRGA